MKIQLLFISTVLYTILLSCGVPNFRSATGSCVEIFKLLTENCWSEIYSSSSTIYRNRNSLEDFHNIKDWTDDELGGLLEYNNKYMYSASEVTNPLCSGRVVFVYKCSFERGQAEIIVEFIKEKNDYKLADFKIIRYIE